MSFSGEMDSVKKFTNSQLIAQQKVLEIQGKGGVPSPELLEKAGWEGGENCSLGPDDRTPYWRSKDTD